MTATAHPTHRVSVAVAHVHAELDTVTDVPLWSMDPAETASTLVELTRLKAQVTELESRVAMHADEVQVGADVGATSTANWLAHTTQQTRAAAHRTVRLGYDLDTHDHVRNALAQGGLVVEQADVILRAVKALPDDIDCDLVIEA